MNETRLRALSGIEPLHTGPGSASRLLSQLPSGPIAVVIGTGLPGRPGPARDLLLRLEQAFPCLRLPLATEPSDLWVDHAREAARGFRVNTVLSLGGGSVLDAGKALAALLTEAEPARRYLEGVGDLPPSGRMLPWFALPATAGTGSEASTNAVLSRPGPGGFKKSLRHPDYRPAGLALDPDLTRDLPPLWTAACGMDAITQLLEAWSSRRCPSDLRPELETAILAAIPALERAATRAPDADSADRQILLDAAFLSGLGLSRAGLGTCHGLAGPIGARRPLPHAILCARLMAPCLAETLHWLRTHPDHSPQSLAAFQTLLGRLSGWHPDPLRRLLEWRDVFHIPPLAQSGFSREDLQAVLPAASNRGSPAALPPDCWKRILETA